MPPRRRSSTRTTAPKRGTRPTAITKVQGQSRFKNWMLVGDTGVGKTTLAGGLPNALFITFDAEGTESAAVEGTDADEVVVRTRAEYLEVQDYFELGTGCDDYQWVIPDSVSEMEECFWRSQLRDQHERKPSTRSLYKPALDDYPWVWNQTKAAIDTWNRMPVNVLYTAQVMPLAMYDDDADEDFDQLVPMIGSQKNGILARKVAGMVSLLGHYQVVRGNEGDDEEDNEDFRRLYVSPRRDVLAKNRYGWSGYVDDVTLPALVRSADKALAGQGPRSKKK